MIKGTQGVTSQARHSHNFSGKMFLFIKARNSIPMRELILSEKLSQVDFLRDQRKLTFT